MFVSLLGNNLPLYLSWMPDWGGCTASSLVLGRCPTSSARGLEVERDYSNIFRCRWSKPLSMVADSSSSILICLNRKCNLIVRAHGMDGLGVLYRVCAVKLAVSSGFLQPASIWDASEQMYVIRGPAART